MDDDQRDARITTSAPYGQHIGLRCRNHPHLRWHTKNIAPIGCRRVFYDSANVPECTCPAGDLEPE